VCQAPDGRVVRDADTVEVKSAVRVRLSRGSLTAVVTSRQ
jgi:hypothetical protein